MKKPEPTKPSLTRIVDLTEQDAGKGVFLGLGANAEGDSIKTGIETMVVEFEGNLTVLKIDHDKKRLGAWALVKGKWVPGDMDAFYEGKVLHGTQVPTSPPLAEW